MALSPKERERIIEEETLRYETRKNLACGNCSGRPRRWPWILAGLAIVWLLFCHIFCGGSSCGFREGAYRHCPYASQESSVAPGQPLPSQAPAKK